MDEAIRREVKRESAGTGSVFTPSKSLRWFTLSKIFAARLDARYRYNDKSYQVVINASTGEVQGERRELGKRYSSLRSSAPQSFLASAS